MRLKHKQFLGSLAFVMPALALFLLLVYYPFLHSVFVSFTGRDGTGEARFIGFGNYDRLFTERSLAEAAGNTAYFAAMTLLAGNPLILLLALALHRPMRARGLVRTLYYLPQIMSAAVMSMVWSAILRYDGVVNALLRGIGLNGWTRDWLSGRASAMNGMVVFNIWHSVGLGAMIVLAGLHAIPPDTYEAARLEGAAGWRSFRTITLPLLRPSITIVNFLLLVEGLKVFEAPLILTGGGPGGSTMTLALLIYRIAFQYNSWGYATAAGALYFVLIAICTLLLLQAARRREVEY